MIQGGKSGVAQYVLSLVRGLQRHTKWHEFTLFALEKDLPLFSFAHESMTLVAVSEKYRSAVKNILWHQHRLPRLVRSYRLDVLHVPSYRRLLSRRPCPLVGTIHDLAPFQVPNKYDWKRMFYGRVVVRWLARRQDRIIAVSQNTAKDIETFFHLPKDRIKVIHNGIDHTRFGPAPVEPAKSWVSRRYGLGGRYFLYVARLEHPGKNHIRLIEAFDLFKAGSSSDWQLVFAGDDWHGAEAIHARIAQSPNRKHICSLGFIPDSSMADLYRAADAFVYPSLYEGFGLPPLEAMACGSPVICSTRGSLGEVIGQAALTIDPENVSQMAAQLGKIATDEQTRNRLREAGFAQAAQFDWARTTAETLRVYEQAGSRAAVSHFVRGCETPVGY
jgi:glycosyltransferase involved in cell wall biosynthesis